MIRQRERHSGRGCGKGAIAHGVFGLLWTVADILKPRQEIHLFSLEEEIWFEASS